MVKSSEKEKKKRKKEKKEDLPRIRTCIKIFVIGIKNGALTNWAIRPSYDSKVNLTKYELSANRNAI